MKTIYASSQEELNVKSIGLHHDHCHWYFSGHIKNLPLKFNRYRKGNMKYLLIYEETKPSCTHEKAYYFHENAPKYYPKCKKYIDGEKELKTKR